MHEFKLFARSSLKLAADLCRDRVVPLCALLAVSSAIGIGSESFLSDLDPDADRLRLGVQLSVGLWGLIEGILLTLILAGGVARVREMNRPGLFPNPFRGDYLPSFLAEYFRGLAQVLLWTLVFLVPGFVRYVRLLFLPYVALFSKAYREGRVDAIALSKRLTVGRMPMLLAMTLGPAALELALVFLPQVVDALHAWPVRIAFDLVGYAVSIYVFAFLFQSFERAVWESEWT